MLARQQPGPIALQLETRTTTAAVPAATLFTIAAIAVSALAATSVAATVALEVRAVPAPQLVQ